MMQHEFEKIAGYKVSAEDYSRIIEPMYMATDMSKSDFVKCIDRKRFEAKETENKMLKLMKVRCRTYDDKTPNGCYYYVELVNVVDIRIADRKYIVEPATDKDIENYMASTGRLMVREGLAYNFDMDYTDCIDKKSGKPVELNFEY